MRDEFDALLLDLDGTLLDLGPDFFRGPMVVAMAEYFPGIPLEKFRTALWGAYEEIMAGPRPAGEKNAEGFFRAFSRETGLGDAEARAGVAAFYREGFPGLERHAVVVAGACDLVTAARARGLRLVLATNPIFPRQANLERLKWAGIPPQSFDLIPGLDEFSSCKPQIEYFRACASAIGVAPRRCLMVGNDEEQDLPAGRVGIRTFLVRSFRISRGRTFDKPWKSGEIADLGKLLGLW